MSEAVKFVRELFRQRHENAILDAIMSFALYFLIIIAVVLGFIFIVKAVPWIVKQSGKPIYRLFASEKEEKDSTDETYHHIEKPLKKLDF